MQKKLFLCGVSLYTSHMTATQEALEAMAKAEAAWDKMVDRTVEVSGQFVGDCKAFQQDQQEWLLEKKDLRSAK
tara:strand:+ start:3468 stop:3689 length:222 start_codon:yes stop_codon:yes gene_type:complete